MDKKAQRGRAAKEERLLVMRYPAGCARPGGVSCIAAHALKHVLTQHISFPID
jgi:hypothetical protein